MLEPKFLVLTGQSHNTRISHPSIMVGGIDHVFMAMANWHNKKKISGFTRAEVLNIEDLPRHWSQTIKDEYVSRWNYLKENGEFAFILEYYPEFFDFYYRGNSLYGLGNLIRI